jgi:hypothetical protein
LAAEGNVVIAMEHRDGTAPVTIHPVDGISSTHVYLKTEELEYASICCLTIFFLISLYSAGEIPLKIP